MQINLTEHITIDREQRSSLKMGILCSGFG